MLPYQLDCRKSYPPRQALSFGIEWRGLRELRENGGAALSSGIEVRELRENGGLGSEFWHRIARITRIIEA